MTTAESPMSSVPEVALAEILKSAEVAPASAANARIVGDDPVIPTRYRIGAAGSAAIAAAGLAAASIWKMRTGRKQEVEVDVRAAVASLRSSRYMKLDGPAQRDPMDPLSGFYQASGGRWVFIHCNFPNHRDHNLAVLGVAAPKKEDMAAAAANWEGRALEDAFMTSGGCGAFARTTEEWAQHPQAAAVAPLPLVEIVHIGDALPEPLPRGERPLAGVRVLDLTRVLAGSTCARTLAEHGAEVLKITAPHLPNSGSIELDTGLGKLSAHLDLRNQQDVETLRTLVRGADVFSQSYRPGALASRGFSPEALAEMRPGIVCVELRAWGREGPWRERRGFDTIVQTATGMALVSGGGTEPRLMPVSAIDYISGHLMAYGAMVALARRVQEGGSWLVRVSLARTGKFIVDRGLLDAAALESVPDDLPAEEIARLTTETQTPIGRLHHLAPVVQMSETRARWARPPVPLGTHPPRWPDQRDP
jgi:crotonobetainyl-CoA:carnitine CoA-transferase CaiB-like acyl-CoA transferase